MPNQIMTTNNQSDSASIVNIATGQLVGDGGTPVAVVLNVGFLARSFKLTQIVGAGSPITYEWSEGMANSNCIMSIAAGTQTVDATHGPVVADRTITIPAAALLASGSYVWEARA